MDYLYINAIVKEVYKDLPCGCSFPADYSKILYSTISNQDCLSNPRITNVLSGFTMRTKNQTPVIVLSNVQKHTNSASVGRFIQCIGWTWNSDLMMQKLDEVLTVDFYSESEINETALRNGIFPLPKNRHSELQELPVSMSEQVKRAVLTTIMLRWLRFDAPLRIAVPANVDYNSYVVSAVRQIYDLLPVSLRARAGFCSYLPSNKDVPESIYIGFVPEDMADARTLSLDGSSPAACAKLSSGTDNSALDMLIRYIAFLSDENRQGFFAEILQELEDSGSSEGITSVSVNAFQNLGVALELMTLTGSLEELMPQWEKRFFEKRSNFTPTMQKRIGEQIKRSVENEEFYGIFRNRCQKSSSEALDVLLSYRNYCDLSPALADKLWEITVTQLAENRTNTQILNLVNHRSEELAFVLDDTKQDQLFCRSIEERLQASQAKPADDLESVKQRIGEAKKLRDEVNSVPETEGTAALLEKIKQYGKGMNAKHGQLNNQRLKAEFEQVKQLPAETVADCQEAISSATELLGEIDRIKNPSEEDQQLRDAVNGFIQEKEAFINSSDAKFQQIEEIFNKRSDYFRILEELHKADKSQLEERHLDTIRDSLDRLRPKQLEIYANNFEAYFGNSLTLANVAVLPDFICGIIIRDICRLNKINLQLPEKSRAGEAAALIEGALHTAGKISDSCEVAVRYGYDSVNSDWFRKLLRLSHDTRSVGDFQEMERVFSTLVENGAFTGDDMIPALEMFIRCDSDLNQLFSYILQGSFRNCSPYQYHAAYEMLLASRDEKPQTVVDYLYNRANLQDNRDRTAYRVFQEFAKAHEPEEGGKKSGNNLLPVVYGMGAAIVVLLAVVVVMLINNLKRPGGDDPTTAPTDEPISTTEAKPEIVYPEEFHFFGKESDTIQKLYGNGSELSFHSRNQVVTSVLDNADAELAEAILAQYSSHRGTAVKIDDKGTCVKWEEYLFWTCWYYSDAESAQLKAVIEQTVPAEEVLSVLRVIYRSLPVEEFAVELPVQTEPAVTVPVTEATEPIVTEVTEPAASETADPSEPAGTEDTSATEPTTEPEATTVPEETVPEVTVPPVTMEEVKAAISQAAERSYVASLQYAEELILVQKLFGAEFQLRFEDHIEKVQSLKLAEDPTSANYHNFIKHYMSLPGNSVIRFDSVDEEITWNEYVFWECWILADRGVEVIDENTFNGDLHKDVMSVLSMIYGLVEDEDLPANLEELLAAAAQPEAEETVPTEAVVDNSEPTELPEGATDPSGATEAATEPTEAPVETTVPVETTEPIPPTEEQVLMEMLFESAREAYEDAQAIYQVIYNQVKDLAM